MKLSFRNRIALFSALAAAATLGMVFLVVYDVVYYTAYNHLDEDIRQEKDEVLNNLRWTGDSLILEQMPEWNEAEHQQVEVNPVFLQIVNKKGQLRYRSPNLQKDILLFDPELSREDYFNSRIGDQRIRQGQFPIPNEQGRVLGHLTIGLSQEESAVVLHNLRNTLWIAFPLLLIILFLVTSLAASKGIAPVKQLMVAASGITEKNINVRLPLPENKDEIFHLATTINELLQRVESGIKREKQFAADASHEIRTPLTAIRGTLEVLLRKQREPIQYEEKIQRVIRVVDRLNVMLDQLLQLARLEGGHIPLKLLPVDLSVYFQRRAEGWQSILQEHKMALRLQIPVGTQCITDAALLDIILDNLLSNAIKYAKDGKYLDFDWNTADAVLTVRDYGMGIPEEHLPHIFNRFYRADDSRSATIPGAGLGLSMAKKLADLLGIRLTVSSRSGAGTTFELRFPSSF